MVTLPSRTDAAPGRRRGIGVPSSQDVQQVRVSGDPGVSIPSGAFGAPFAAAAEGLSGAADAIRRAAARQEKRFDATETAKAQLAYERDSMAEFRRRQVEDDPSRPDFMTDYEKFLAGRIERTMGELPEGVSEEAREKLRIRLLQSGQNMADGAGRLQIEAGQRAAIDAISELTNKWSAQATENPDFLPEILDDADGNLSDFADTMTADAERDQRAAVRENVIRSAVDGYLAQTRFDDAEALLGSEEYAGDIQPSTRETLTARIERKREAHERKILTELRGDVSDAVTVLEAGKTPPNLESLRGRASGTELQETLDHAVEDAGEMARFNRVPVPQMTAELERLNDQEVMTARDVRLLGRKQRAYASHIKAIKADPLAHGESLELYELAPLDFDDPASLRARADAARQASDHFGVRVGPLRPVEVDNLKEAFRSASPEQVTGMFSTIVSGLEEEAAFKAAEQIAGDDPALGLALAVANDTPLVSAEIVNGQRLLKENPDVKPTATEIESLVSSTYGDLFADVPGALNVYVDAAKALYAAKKVPSGDFVFDNGAFSDALELAAGGLMNSDGNVEGGPIDFNGRKILPPVAGMDGAAFEDMAEALTLDEMTRFGNGMPIYDDGRAFDPAQFDTGFFGSREAQFVTVGQGRYRVVVPGLGYLLSDSGDVYEIDLRSKAQGAEPRPMTAPTPVPSTPSGEQPDTRGFRNNNPGNIRGQFFGAIGTDEQGFARFSSMEEGREAIDQQLQRYASGKTTGEPLNTVREIVSTWAPPSDNNPTEKYIDFVAGRLGVFADETLDMNDPDVRNRLTRAIIQFENGIG